MATVTFLEPGSDATEDLSLWGSTGQTGGSATIASDSGQAFTGPRSIKAVVTNDTTDFAYVFSPNAVITDAGSAISFRIRLSVIPSVLSPLMATEQINDGTSILMLGVDTDGKILVGMNNNAGGSTAKGTTVLSATTWYRICLSYTITGASTFTVKVFLNGTLEVTLNTGTFFSTPVLPASSCVIFGLGDGSSNSGFPDYAAMTCWYDDIYIDNRTDLTDTGDIHVTAKRPFANGTTNGFTGSGTPSGYGSGNARYVNERPLNQTNNVAVTVVASAITEEYTIEGLSVGDVDLTGATLKGVIGWIFAKSSITEADQIVVDGSLTSLSVTSTPAAFFQLSPNPTTYPAGTGSDIGMKTNATAATATLYECGILVAYLAAAGGAAPIGRAVESIQSRNRASTF